MASNPARQPLTDFNRPVVGPAVASALPTILLVVLVIAVLYLAREVLVPIALALLLSFVLAPLVRILRSLYIPRWLGVIVAVIVGFAVIFGLGALMVSQVNQLATDLPRYQSTLSDKIQSLRGAAAGTGTLERASEVLKNLGKELDKPQITTAWTIDLRHGGGYHSGRGDRSMITSAKRSFHIAPRSIRIFQLYS
jgi:predicted PurR-regulated permease PerM